MVSAYFIITELINAIRTDMLSKESVVEVLEKVLLVLDNIELTAEEQRQIATLLRGEKEYQ